ncbi:hypothetical protein AALP_AA8G310600 [Arabis alpina]|nr:hypothetical protein AALP_AA8G310600 [Arabis alpina]
MLNNGRELSAREKRAVEARTGSNARVSQRAGSLTPTPEVGATAAPKSGRPDLERNVLVATDNQPKPLQKRHNETRKKDDGVEKGRKCSREGAEGNVTVGDDTVISRRSKSPRRDGVQRAVEKAKRDMAIKYEDMIGQASRKIKLINGTLRVPDLDAELVALKKQEAGLLSATDEFAFHMGKLEDILKDPSAGGTESRVVGVEANAVPALSSSGPSGNEDSSSSTTKGPL